MCPSLFPVAVDVNDISWQEVNMDPKCCLATQFRCNSNWNALKLSVADREGEYRYIQADSMRKNNVFFLTYSSRNTIYKYEPENEHDMGPLNVFF